jgi:hypothetical protein
MASGTLVVATPVGGILSVIEHRKTGFIVKSNDPHVVASQVLELLQNSNQFEKIRINARKIIVENYTKKAAVRRWSSIFGKVQNRETME